MVEPRTYDAIVAGSIPAVSTKLETLTAKINFTIYDLDKGSIPLCGTNLGLWAGA